MRIEQALLLSPPCLSSFADSEKCPSEKSKRKKWEKKFSTAKFYSIIFCENKALLFSICSIGWYQIPKTL